MGSPLSSALAYPYLEFLESKSFKHILPNDIQYFRYIDNILIIYPKEHSFHHIKNSPKLNQALISHMNLRKMIPFLSWISYL